MAEVKLGWELKEDAGGFEGGVATDAETDCGRVVWG
jgi:hypothetical protein